MRFNGLLVEVGARTATGIEAVTANWAEMTLLGYLQFHQPAQSRQASIKYRCLPGCSSAQNQSVGELCIIVGQLVFKPVPVRFCVHVEEFHEPGSKRLTSLIDQAVPA